MATITTNQFKNGTHIEVDGQIFRILEFQHVKPGKGGAFVRSKLRNVDTGAVLDKTFRAGEKVRPVRTETRKMQYLYESGDEAVMMDLTRLRAALAAQDGGRRLARLDHAQRRGGGPVRRRAPVGHPGPERGRDGGQETDPGVRGDTASGGGNKPATLESGVTVQVPLFVNEGDRVRVDTRTREYVSRA